MGKEKLFLGTIYHHELFELVGAKAALILARKFNGGYMYLPRVKDSLIDELLSSLPEPSKLTTP